MDQSVKGFTKLRKLELMSEKEQLTEEMRVYEMAYLRGRDAHQKRVLQFMNDYFTLCSNSHDSDDQHRVCQICQGAKVWHDAIKSQLDRKSND